MKKLTLSTVQNYDFGNGFAKILELDSTYIQESFPLVSQWDAIIDVYQQGLRIGAKKARHFKYAVSWVAQHELRIYQLNEDICNDKASTILAQVATTNGVDLYVSSLYDGNSRVETRVDVIAFNNWGKWIDASKFEDISSLNPTYCKGSDLNASADYHNSVFRGKDLTGKYTIDELEAKIANGDFSDLFIGDYITKETTVNGVAETIDYVFAGFDYYRRIGNSGNGLTNHHAVIVTRESFGTNIKMEDSATTANGYYGSKGHGIASGTSSNAGLTNILVDYDTFKGSSLGSTGTYTFTYNGSTWGYDGSSYTYSQMTSNFGVTYSGTPTNGDTLTISFTVGNIEQFRSGIYTVFGKDHCLPYKDYLTTSSSTGAWKTGRVEILNESMVFGNTVNAMNNVGERTKNSQLPLFQHSPQSKVVTTRQSNTRKNYWLSSINSSSNFCAVGSWGNADYKSANSDNSVRLFFLLG